MMKFPGKFNNYVTPTSKPGLHSYDKPTETSRQHHHTTDRLTGSNSDRKHLNLVPRSHGAQMINQTVEGFIKSGEHKRKLGAPIAKQILIQYHRSPDPSDWSESFVWLGKSKARIWFDGDQFWLAK